MYTCIHVYYVYYNTQCTHISISSVKRTFNQGASFACLLFFNL